jgi:integrase
LIKTEVVGNAVIREREPELVKGIAPRRVGGVAPPRVHDLRHSFAKLLHLSTFLGHVDPTSTATYLTIRGQTRSVMVENLGVDGHGPLACLG